MTDLPSTSDIVIIGGGVMGASTAYHLALSQDGLADLNSVVQGCMTGARGCA